MTHPPEWFRQALAAPRRSVMREVEGCLVHAFEWGQRGAPGLILVHGGAAHAHWWTCLAPQLAAQGYHVIAPDLSGHGDSGRRPDYPYATWTRELFDLADHVDMQPRPLLIGHSMGGLLGMVTAAARGDELRGALIIDAPVNPPDPDRRIRASANPFATPGTYPTLAIALERFKLIPPQPCANDWLVDHVARHSLVETQRGWAWKYDPRVFAVPRIPDCHVIGDARCPLAFVRGEHSIVVPRRLDGYMATLAPVGTPFREIPNAHHHVLLDEPLALLDALLELIPRF